MKTIHNKILTTLTCAVGVALSPLLAPSSFGTVTIDMVTVGNPGNPADTLVMNDSTTGYGSVSYTYNIGKYEVSNAQYVEFLNTVDATGANSLSLYNASMTSDAVGGINYTAGNPNGSKYSVKAGQGNNPVVYVSFFDSMRFVNWLHNGQTSGGTESGVYTIGTGLSETRAGGATYWLPSENEWYKAAYYDPTKGGTGYWLYPMKTDSEPYSDQPPGTSSPDASKSGNFYRYVVGDVGYNDGYAVGPPSYLTDVGAYTTASSYYGTFDQGGNVWERNEAVISGSSRGVRGGNWNDGPSVLIASFRGWIGPSYEDATQGFRVAGLFNDTVPEPSTVALLLCGLGFLARRRSQR